VAVPPKNREKPAREGLLLAAPRTHARGY